MIVTVVTAVLANIFGWKLWEPWATSHKRTQSQRAFNDWQAKVKLELRQPGVEPWAGVYKRSDAHADFVLSIAPQTGWAMDKTKYCDSCGCSGPYTEQIFNIGTCELTNGVIQTKASLDNSGGDGVLVPIQFGDDWYLIHPAHTPKFEALKESMTQSAVRVPVYYWKRIASGTE
ncbi:MAG: hypothetical protein ABL921_11555 [Pirellula sp.]